MKNIFERNILRLTLVFAIGCGGNGKTRASSLGAGSQALNAANLVSDGGFESSVSGFYAPSGGDSVTRSPTNPITGTASLEAVVGAWDNAWWDQSISDANLSHASAYTVTADIRPETIDSKSAPQLCATVYYASGAFAGTCVNVTQTQNVVQHVQAVLTLDSTQALGSVHIRLSTTGSVTLHYALDNVVATLTLPGGTPPPTAPPPTTPPPTTPPPTTPPPTARQ